MHRIDRVVQSVEFFKMSKTFPEDAQISALAEHEDISILYGISADKDPIVQVEKGDAAWCVPWDVDDLQRAVPKIDHDSLFDRSDLSCTAVDSVVILFCGAHENLVERSIS